MPQNAITTKTPDDAGRRTVQTADDQKTPAYPDTHTRLLALQGSAGNQAVARLLSSGSQHSRLPFAADAGLRSAAAPLHPHLRAEMEDRFGFDFDAVRVHHNPTAARSAQALQARAYTVGSDLVFGAGEYAPHSSAGRRLLAHELAHTVQQSRGGATPPPPVGERGYLEADADRVAEATVETSGPVEVAGASAPGIALQPATYTKQTPDAETLARLASERTAQDPAQTARDMLRAVETMQFLGQAGRYSIEVGGQLYEIDEVQYQANEEGARKAIRGLINTTRDGARDIDGEYAAILEINRHWYYRPLTAAMEYFYDVEEPGDRLTTPLIRYFAHEAEAALAAGRYSDAYDQLLSGHTALMENAQVLTAYTQELIKRSHDLYAAVERYRKTFDNVLIGIGAVLLAPEVLTVGAVAMIVGGAGLVGGAGEGSVELARQAVTGQEIDLGKAREEGIGGAKGGVVAASTGLVTAGTARMFTPATTWKQAALHGAGAGTAGGTVGGGLGAALEGRSAGEVVEASFYGGLEGLLGGGIGGGTGFAARGLRLPARVVAGGAGGATGSGIGAYFAGRSPEEITQAVLLGGIAGGAMSALEGPQAGQARLEETALAQTRQAAPEQTALVRPRPATSGGRLPPWDQWRHVEVDANGVHYRETGGVVAGKHPGYPETVFLRAPDGSGPPMAFTRLADGGLMEIPWPFSKRLTVGPEPAAVVRPGEPLRPAQPAAFPAGGTAVHARQTESATGSARAAAPRAAQAEDVAQPAPARATAEPEPPAARGKPFKPRDVESERAFEEMFGAHQDPQLPVLASTTPPSTSDAPSLAQAPEAATPARPGWIKLGSEPISAEERNPVPNLEEERSAPTTPGYKHTSPIDQDLKPQVSGGRAGVDYDWAADLARTRFGENFWQARQYLSQLRMQLLAEEDILAVYSSISEFGYAIEPQVLRTIKAYNFDSPGIIFTRENYESWTRLASGNGTITDLRYLIHEAEEVGRLQTVRERTGFDFLGTRWDQMTPVQRAAWRNRFLRVVEVDENDYIIGHYIFAHGHALASEFVFIAEQVRRITGDQTFSGGVAAAIDTSMSGADARQYMLVNNVPLANHPQFEHWRERATEPVPIDRATRRELGDYLEQGIRLATEGGILAADDRVAEVLRGGDLTLAELIEIVKLLPIRR